MKCFFLVENFHFGRPKSNFSGFEKWKAKKKKKKKKVLSSFCNFSTFHFQFSTFPFTIFLLFFSISTPFPFFPCLLFPCRSAEISRSEESLGVAPACYATARRERDVPAPHIWTWDPRHLIPLCVLALSVMELQLGVFGSMPSTHAEANMHKCAHDLHTFLCASLACHATFYARFTLRHQVDAGDISSCECNKVVSAFWSFCRRSHFVFKFLLFFIVLDVLFLS